MTAYYGDNYTKQYITKPMEKVEPGEVAGRRRCLLESFDLDVAVLNGDTIACGFLPAGARVLNASLKVDKSLGATGIFQLGHAASTDHAADADAFVSSADAGGQAVKANGGIEAGIHKKFTSRTQVLITCTEDMDGTVLTGKITADIEYVVD